MRMHPLLVLLCSAAIAPGALAQLAFQDVKGGKDHPLLSRFSGSVMVGYNEMQYEEAELPTGRPYFRSNKLLLDQALKLEGKYTRIAYVFPTDRSGLEVFRNYQAALAKAGMKVVYTCEKEACGYLGSYYNGSYLLRDGFLNSSTFRNAFHSGLSEPRYLVAKGAKPDGTTVHVALLVAPPLRGDLGGVSLQIVEGKPMETGKVAATLSADEMARSIASQGRAAVYGVYFDTNRAAVKPASKEALGEMARLLQQDGKLKVHIVGHTDNQGAPAHNIELSQKRAEAVVAILASEYRIDAKRLSAKGVGAYAPVASNDDEAGREKNRRVELVKQ
ncbi:OmpA family protein [Massilia sp. MS-15]|uniref:OmpA family protein n=1 Tax=Massilia sp. MS-15 TaxID=2878200 RepID=UPI001CD73271|nr:OmpA family protein [Massilia sp. MS-15]MCA1247690.1 DUF4892 domain-containing protein [Massilia sp. MS-15]